MQHAKRLSEQLTPESLRWLCKTWWYDKTPQGIEWATELLAAYISEQQTVNETLLEIMLHSLGIAERIYKSEGRHADFRSRLDAFQKTLPDKLQSIAWYATQTLDRSRPALASLDTFDWVPGDEQGHHERTDDYVVFTAHPEQGFNHLNIPRRAIAL